jgi:hypothetical protein
MTESILSKLNVTSPYYVLLINYKSLTWLLAQRITTNEKKNPTHYGSGTEWKNVRTNKKNQRNASGIGQWQNLYIYRSILATSLC